MTKPLTHLSHPEDTILTGDLSVLELLYGKGKVSLKIDGAPAVVWGIDPNNNKFFVATKSAFNKKKIKRCYSIEDIYKYYNQETHGSLIEVLVSCYKHLPVSDGIYQGDFIGFGGSDSYKPNTITYEFENVVTEDIIVAPHTYYTGDDFPTMIPHPLEEDFTSTKSCLFVQPFVDRIHHEISLPNIDTNKILFLSDKEATQAKMSINALIRSGQTPDESTLNDILGSSQLTNLYLFVEECKYDLMETFIVYDSPVAFIDDERITGEGFVMSNGKMSIKLVDRPKFAFANMTQGRFN